MESAENARPLPVHYLVFRLIINAIQGIFVLHKKWLFYHVHTKNCYFIILLTLLFYTAYTSGINKSIPARMYWELDGVGAPV